MMHKLWQKRQDGRIHQLGHLLVAMISFLCLILPPVSMAGGLYLMLRGFIRWEISLSFLAGIFVTALLFKFFDASGQYEGPLFHLLTGYTLIGAFFLATEDSSSPVNFIPMLIYGAGCGVMTILIRNFGAYVDGVVFAILFMNLVNPLVDKLRPKALGKVV